MIFLMDIGAYYEQQTRNMQMQVNSFTQMSIKKEDISCGHTIYHRHSVEQFINPKQCGNLTLEVEFSNNIASPLVLCVDLQFDSDIIINEIGEVLTIFD